MYTLVAVLVAALLSLAAQVTAQQLDRIKNMCVRYDHQCMAPFIICHCKDYIGSNLGQQ